MIDAKCHDPGSDREQIAELYHSVRESPADGRAALLAQADPELRREVESLLGRDRMKACRLSTLPR